MRLAVIADIHGNRWALDAVLDDIERRGVDHVVNLGDHLYGPLDPAGTAARLATVNGIAIRGNQDRALYAPDPAVAAHPTYQFCLAELGDDVLPWLRGLRATASLEEGVLLCHGTPDADDRYLLEAVGPTGCALRAPADIARDLRGVESGLVCCGHSHVPRLVAADRWLVLNPGSVGLPAFADDVPVHHRMEAGSPHARYAVVERADGGWAVRHVAVAYDWQAAAGAARAHGRPDWAFALETGRAA